jgi:hypothetical protein
MLMLGCLHDAMIQDGAALEQMYQQCFTCLLKAGAVCSLHAVLGVLWMVGDCLGDPVCLEMRAASV